MRSMSLMRLAELRAVPRRTACLTSAMALVTSMPRGQASEQLKVVRQRQTPSLSLRMSRRTLAPSSRESKMKRCALTIAAGPKYWPSVQNTGQLEVQAAQRMHLVVSSKRSRSHRALHALLAVLRRARRHEEGVDLAVGLEERAPCRR